MVASLDDCGDICKTHKVPFQSIQAQNELITEGIIEVIVNQRIQKLVMGAAANRSYFRTLTPMSKKATFVLHNAPNFCHIWFVCNSHLVFTRERVRQHTENIERIQLNKSSSEYLRSSLLCASTDGSSSQSPSIHHALSCNSMPPNIIDNVYAHYQLQQTEKDSKELTEKLHIESSKKQKAEIEASEKNLKMQDVDKILIQMEAELTLTKNHLNKTLNELGDASTQITSFQSQTSQWNIKVKKKESELITSTNSHNMYKKLSNGLQEKLDRIAQEQQILPCEYIESDLQEATNSFDSSFKVAEGDYGCIYRGFLSYSDVAIKMLRTNSLRCTLEFKQEVDILGKLHHPHVVALLGMCTQPWGLIYEYLPNGSLQDRLNCKGNTLPLPWHTRIQIAAELCSALAFLHSRKPDSIIHGDINPENVLLGDNFICKLSGFGSCRVISNTRVDFQTALKTDVYSFGVILLCLLTAEPPTGIKEKVQSSLTNDDLYNILDHSAGQWPLVRATQLAHMALWCCHVLPDNRPDLTSEVWMVLKPSIDPSLSLSNPVQLIREDQIPSDFICPINQDIMHDPHFAADGFTYEESAIKRWFDGGHETSPMTNLRLENRHLTPNHALRSAIEKWQQKHRCV